MAPLYPTALASFSETGSTDRRLHAALQRFPRSLFFQKDGQSPHEGELEVFPERLVPPVFEALALTGKERVLEIGSATGYLTALLSHLAAQVYSVTSEPALAEERRRQLEALGCSNVQVVHAALGAGWPIAAPYQAILVGAGAPEVPRELVDQLDLGGRLIIPVGDTDAQMLECIRKRAGALHSETLGGCRMKMLAGATRPPSIYPWTRQRQT